MAKQENTERDDTPEQGTIAPAPGGDPEVSDAGADGPTETTSTPGDMPPESSTTDDPSNPQSTDSDADPAPEPLESGSPVDTSSDMGEVGEADVAAADNSPEDSSESPTENQANPAEDYIEDGDGNRSTDSPEESSDGISIDSNANEAGIEEETDRATPPSDIEAQDEVTAAESSENDNGVNTQPAPAVNPAAPTPNPGAPTPTAPSSTPRVDSRSSDDGADENESAPAAESPAIEMDDPAPSSDDDQLVSDADISAAPTAPERPDSAGIQPQNPLPTPPQATPRVDSDDRESVVFRDSPDDTIIVGQPEDAAADGQEQQDSDGSLEDASRSDDAESPNTQEISTQDEDANENASEPPREDPEAEAATRVEAETDPSRPAVDPALVDSAPLPDLEAQGPLRQVDPDNSSNTDTLQVDTTEQEAATPDETADDTGPASEVSQGDPGSDIESDAARLLPDLNMERDFSAPANRSLDVFDGLDGIETASDDLAVPGTTDPYDGSVPEQDREPTLDPAGGPPGIENVGNLPSVESDGSVRQELPDGTVNTFYLDENRQVIRATSHNTNDGTGTEWARDPATGQWVESTWRELDEGIILTTQNPDGSTTTTHPDGSWVTETEFPDGGEGYEPGTFVEEHSDGTVIVYEPNGNTITTHPDKSETWTTADGTRVEVDSQGNVVYDSRTDGETEDVTSASESDSDSDSSADDSTGESSTDDGIDSETDESSTDTSSTDETEEAKDTETTDDPTGETGSHDYWAARDFLGRNFEDLTSGLVNDPRVSTPVPDGADGTGGGGGQPHDDPSDPPDDDFAPQPSGEEDINIAPVDADLGNIDFGPDHVYGSDTPQTDPAQYANANEELGEGSSSYEAGAGIDFTTGIDSSTADIAAQIESNSMTENEFEIVDSNPMNRGEDVDALSFETNWDSEVDRADLIDGFEDDLDDL